MRSPSLLSTSSAERWAPNIIVTSHDSHMTISNHVMVGQSYDCSNAFMTLLTDDDHMTDDDRMKCYMPHVESFDGHSTDMWHLCILTVIYFHHLRLCSSLPIFSFMPHPLATPLLRRGAWWDRPSFNRTEWRGRSTATSPWSTGSTSTMQPHL